MTGTINPDQIKGLKIFDSASQHLPLCGSHNRELSEEIAGDLDDLVHSHFFQEKFGALFPEDLAGAHLNMRLKDNSLIVQLMREESSGRRLAPEGEAVVIDLTAPADEETIEINQTILDKADALFRKCQNGHIRSHRSTAAPSLRDRAVDLTRFSNDDLLDELAARRHDTIDDLVPTPRRTRSASPDRLERRTRGTRENPDDTLRGARQAQLNLQIQAERLSRDSDATDEQLIPLYEQIRRLEEQIQRLSEQLGAPASTTATRASDSTPLLERVLDRLARINERLDLLEGSRTVPTTTPSPDRTDSLEQPDRTARREEDSGSRAARSDSTEQTDLASQREADLENALRRARQDYLDLQREADLLSRRPNPTIEQLAPFLERIRRLEQQIQTLSEQLGIPVTAMASAPFHTTPLLERIFSSLDRIDERIGELERSRSVQSTATPSGSAADSHLLPNPSARREEDPASQRTSSGSTEPTRLPSQRETELENALRRAREAYRDLQLEAERLSRRPDPTIEQLAPLHEHIRRLEAQVQRLSAQLGSPVTMFAAIPSNPAPILEKIQGRLSRIDKHLHHLEGPLIVPASTMPSSDKVDSLERKRAKLKAQLSVVSTQLDSLRERNLELSSQLSALIAPSPNLPRLTDEQFRMLTQLAQQLGHPSVRDSEDFPFATDTRFLDFPQEVRDSVYFQMYAICNPTRVPDMWRTGEKFFLNQEGLHGTNGLRSLAITRYQLQSLANEFATLGNGQTSHDGLMERFNQLSEEDQTGVLRQYQFLHRLSHEPIETTRDSFLSLNDDSATNEERNESISRYLQVQISERYGKMISELTDELNSLTAQLQATEDAYEDALDKLGAEMASLRDQSRLELASAMFRASSLQSDLDSARDQISQLTGDVSSRDLQIAALQRQVDVAADQQRLALAEIDRLTRIGHGKDLEIAQLRVHLRRSEERERNARLDIERLTREGGAKDSRIADLEREALAAAEQQRLARLDIERLTREGGTKDLRISALEQNVRDGAERERLARDEINRLTREGSTKDARISDLEREGKTKDSRIADLEREALAAAEQQRLARDEIDRLTLEGGTKDSRISDLEREGRTKDSRISALEQNVREGADRERLARDEINRLTLEGGAKDSRIVDLEREGRTKDSRISALEQNVREGADRERLARDEIDRLTLEGRTKDSRISDLEREALAAAEQQRLARDEINRLTLEGGAKDSRISVLEREALAAAEQQRLARLEIDRLTLEGGTKDSRIVDLEREGRTKDSRISALEQNVREGADRERLARDEIDRLTLEGGAKDSRISVLEREALAAAEQQRLARLEIDRLTLEGGTKDSSIVDLTRQVREAADLQRDALAEIQRLKREGGTKDSRISDLEREALVAAEQQRLARDEIDRLTLEGGTKDSRISALERDVRKAADLQRDALAEIDRLKREGGTKDLRIADLEQEGGRKDVRIGELEKTIRRLEEELKAAKADWAEKERLHGVAIDEKNARIEEIDQEYRLLQLQKQELQEKYEKLIDESDRNDRALKARIAELEKGIRPLLTKLQDTEFALQEAQAKLEAGTRNFDEMKQRWLKTKQALDEATRIKSALEEESTQHAKAEQAWEKERQRLERAVAAVKEESRLTGVENTELRSNLDNALQRLDAQVKANQRQNFASEKQARELQSTIESLSNDLQFEKERSDRFQRAQRETARRVEELEGQQKDLLRELQEATEERDELRAEYAKLEPQLNKQRDEFGQEIDRVHLEAEERHRAMLEDLERLDRHARALEEELALLRSQRSGPSLAPVDLSNPAAAVDEGREAARQLEEVVREISAEPIIFSRLEQSLIDGYHLNRQLSQVEEMAFDKSSGALRISITDNLARELRLPKVFSLKPGSNEASLGEEFNLSKKPLDRRRDSDRICRLMLIKRLQTIRGELMGAAKGADESKATPWRTWGEVFKNFTTFCKEMNRNLPTLRQHIANYKREFARLRVQGIDEAVLKQCVASRKIPAEINEPQRGEVAGLIRLYQTMAKSCEEIFLYSLPRKIPMHHAWKILMLTNHGLPDRAYEHGRLKPAEAEVVEPLQTLIPEFYRRFSSMLQSIQIDNGRIVE